MKAEAYLAGVASCFAGLTLYGHEINSPGSILPGAVLIIVGVVLLLYSYME